MMKLKIDGMHCNSCVMLIQDAIDDAKINAKVTNGQVEFNESDKNDIIKIVKEEGYEIKA